MGGVQLSPGGEIYDLEEVYGVGDKGVPSCQVYGYPLRGGDLPPGWMNGVPSMCTVIPWGVRLTTWKKYGVGDNGGSIQPGVQ